MNRLLADLRQAFRLFRRSSGFAAAVVAAIALGVGTNTAIFSVVNAVILKPVPFAEPDRIVQLQIAVDDMAFGFNTSPAKFMHWRELDVFSDIAGFQSGVPLNLTQGDAPELISAARVTEGYFRVFAAPVARGRTFTLEEDLPNGPPTVVVSHAFWVNRLAADPDIVGETVSLSGTPHTVIGVLGEGFDVNELGDPEVWVAFRLDPATTEQAHFFRAVARLAPGVTLEQAKARMEASFATFRERYPTVVRDGESFTVLSLQESLVGDTGRTLWVLLGAVGFVLLIACANVASLLLVRAARRRRELAIRAALGADRARIVRQLLTESLLLSAVGGGVGVVAGLAAIRALLSIDTAGLPRLFDGGASVGLDWRIATFSVAVSLGTGLLFGLAPALASARVDLNAVIKSGSRAGSDRREGLMRSALVLAEVALAVVLLIGAALLIRTSIALATVEPGFNADNVLILRTSLTGPRHESTASVAQTLKTGRERLRSIPGVIEAGAACCIPTQFSSNLPFDVVGRETPQGEPAGGADFSVAAPGYFSTFRIPLLRGRDFTDGDTGGALGAVIVNQAFVDRYWQNGADALGERIVIGSHRMEILGGEPERQIIGIVANVRDRGLDEEPLPTMYVPQAQLPDAFNAFFLSAIPVAWAVKTTGDPSRLATLLKQELTDITGVPVFNVETMEHVVSISTARERFNMLLMSIFGGAALVLAALGIYGLIAYSVEQRTQELGIRAALGAEPRQIRGIVLRQGFVLVGSGVVAGVVAALYLSSWLASFLFGVGPRDGVVFVTVPFALTLVGLGTAAIVALRAGRVDPLEALRYD